MVGHRVAYRAFAVALLGLAACSGAPARAASSSAPTAEPEHSGHSADDHSAPRTVQGSATSIEPRYHQALEAHNQLRAEHCARPLRWSESLAKHAQSWADSLRDRGCLFAHNPDGRFGENLSFFAPPESQTPASVVRGWYEEIRQYDYEAPGFSMRTGHFTQVVWSSTVSLGCGVSRCNGGEIWVCNYDPAGNVEGMFPKQVQPKGCK